MKIGFTCSCFDLFHAGHVLMLQEAKTQCDYLIVGLQTDPSIDLVLPGTKAPRPALQSDLCQDTLTSDDKFRHNQTMPDTRENCNC